MSSRSAKERPVPSKALLQVRGKHPEGDPADPGRRLEAAFALSRDLARLFRAGLRAQGFSEAEIEALYRRGRR
ncbi:MAG: hypothetical protein DMG07_22250 [Acidobacteria bacterium]|nr:MAG: hypothetical protein DMG07_22250 [Acidobacteriota bacterium]